MYASQCFRHRAAGLIGPHGELVKFGHVIPQEIGR